MQLLVFDEGGVEARDAGVGFGQRHFDRMISMKSGKDGRWSGDGRGSPDELRYEGVERVADAEPCRDEMARLHPSEDPGDGAQVLHAALLLGAGVGTLGGARADASMFELGDRRGLLEVGEGVGRVDDVLAVEGVGGGREGFERALPFGRKDAGESGAVGVDGQRGTGEGVQRGRDHQLQVALREDDVGVLPVEDFALFGEAEFAGEAVYGLREDGAMRGAAAAPHGASAAVEEAQLDSGFASYGVQSAVGFEDLPGGGNHASVLIGVGVAEHDLLRPGPGFEQRLVRFARPQRAADGRGVLQVFDGFEERDGLQAGIVGCALDAHAADAGETDYVEDILRGRCAGDDVAWERFGRRGLFEVSEGAERFEDFVGLRG